MRTGVKVAHWGMVIDLKRCYGCYACMMACKTANHTPPEVFWARVLMGEVGTYPNAVRQALPVLCMQCEEPSCLEVCPTGATQKRDDGIVIVEKAKCMGCKYCMQACPYGARYSVEKWESYFPEDMPERHYYQPVPRGLELKIGEKLAHLRDLDRAARGKKDKK
jgi:molybdopterin-containing oxidoreductase family iron-sulfur binding subunit